MTLESWSARTLWLEQNSLSVRASLTMTGRPVWRTRWTMLSEIAVSLTASRFTLRAARMRSFDAPLLVGGEDGVPFPLSAGLGSSATASSSSRMRPFSAPVTSMIGVEHRLEHFVDALERHQLLAELVELSQPGDRLGRRPELRVAHRRLRGGRALVRRRAGRGARLVEHAEGELGVPEGEAVAVDQPGAAFFLAVEEDLALLVDLLEVEVAAVEENLRVRRRDPLALHADVVAEGAADRAHRLVQRENVRRTLGRKPLEDGQRTEIRPSVEDLAQKSVGRQTVDLPEGHD